MWSSAPSVVFFEKPGCSTNAKQKVQLLAAGCILVEKNLLDNGLDANALLEFFEDKPVAQWFNPSAPKIKNQEIDPQSLSKEAAIELLMAEPILIRRPLLQIGTTKMCGFEQARIETLIGKKIGEKVSEACSSTSESCEN